MKHIVMLGVMAAGAPGLALAGEGLALGLRAGTLGLGLEGSFGLTEYLNLRVGLQAFQYSDEFDADDVDGVPDNDLIWEGDVELQSGALLLDLHPGASGFRLTGGLIANGNQFGASARCDQASCEVGGQQVSAEDLGTLAVDIDWDSTAPYIGIGFGDAVGKDKRFGFVLDLGIMFQGSGTVAISSDSPQCDTQCRSALDSEERELQDEADDFDLYPVLSIGITFRLL